jgi:hypothetical protein
VLGGGFGAEDAVEARASELDADEAFAVGLLIGNVDDAALGLEIGFAAARGVARDRNANLQVGADGDIEARKESGSAAAQIFTGSVLFEGDAAGVSATDPEREADGDPTFGSLSRREHAERDHGLGPRFL